MWGQEKLLLVLFVVIELVEFTYVVGHSVHFFFADEDSFAFKIVVII